ADVTQEDRSLVGDDGCVAAGVVDVEVAEAQAGFMQVDLVLAPMEVEDDVVAEVLAELEGVVAAAAEQEIVAGTAIELVRPGAAEQLVLAAAAMQVVRAGAAFEAVVAVLAPEVIVAEPAEQPVVALAAVHLVGSGIADQEIIALVAEETVVAAAAAL